MPKCMYLLNRITAKGLKIACGNCVRKNTWRIVADDRSSALTHVQPYGGGQRGRVQNTSFALVSAIHSNLWITGKDALLVIIPTQPPPPKKKKNYHKLATIVKTFVYRAQQNSYLNIVVVHIPRPKLTYAPFTPTLKHVLMLFN